MKKKHFQIMFCNHFREYKWIYKSHVNYSKSVLDDVQTKGNGEINTTLHNYSRNSILIFVFCCLPVIMWFLFGEVSSSSG